MIKLNPREHFEQVTVKNWLERNGVWFFSVPNGSDTTVKNMITLKREGLTKGAPDMVLIDFAPVNGRPTMIENKRRQGAVYSEEQLAIHTRARDEGWNVIAPPKGESGQWVIGQLKALGYGRS